MPTPDFSSPRGPNAGDDFHELWVLRHSLEMLDPGAELKAVAVEGLMSVDEKGVPRDTWDGVDCTFYYGGDSAQTATSVLVDQVKYSGAHPNKNWTVSRLTSTSNKKKDDSVIGRLAKAFSGLLVTSPGLVARGAVRIRLVSNQPMSSAVLKALYGSPKLASKSEAADRAKLQKASGLTAGNFSKFVRVLDLSLCGSSSLILLEERVRTTISEWTDADARPVVEGLLTYVRRLMRPDTKGLAITKSSILVHFGLSDASGLFPCPSRVDLVEKIVPREATRRLVEVLHSGSSRKVVFHGEGGCGKTTALQELGSLLPSDSTIVLFDCYGGGTYLDAEAYRHAPVDAFVQLCNDLARQLRTPLFVQRDPKANHVRVFHKRLVRAAEIVAARDPEALLVVVVDAADNSITAARTRVPEDHSFVHELAAIGNVPENVRIIISARSGRLADLRLPNDYVRVSISAFTREETEHHVKTRFPVASDSWIDDFHHFSSGIPRVQRYAFGDDARTQAEALDYLLPGGRLLPDVFDQLLERAGKLAGNIGDIHLFCAALVTLSRPIPLRHLAAVTDLTELQLIDVCSDLSPGIRLVDGFVSLGDEDFEAYLGTKAEGALPSIRVAVARHFLETHKTDAYSASHVASALYAADLYSQIIDLVNNDDLSAISDPVLKRETRMQRFKIAMKVARITGNTVDALKTLIRGAEALKNDTAILNMLIQNPDLAAQFARERSNRVVLRDPDLDGDHGRLLFQQMVVDARAGDAIAVREVDRQLQAWLQRRQQIIEERREQSRYGKLHEWEIENEDLAAETEAVLRVLGPAQALKSLRRWKPKRTLVQVAGILAENLLSNGDHQLLSDLAAAAVADHFPWNILIQTPLAVAGRHVDLESLERGVASVARSRFIRVASVERTFRPDTDPIADFSDVVLTACEVLIANSVRSDGIRKALELLDSPELRLQNGLRTSNSRQIEICLRAHVLLERLDGRQATLKSFTGFSTSDKPDRAPAISQRQKTDEEQLVDGFIELFDLRARIVLGEIEVSDLEHMLSRALSPAREPDFRSDYSDHAALRFRAALAMSKLTMVQGLGRFSFDAARSLFGPTSHFYDGRRHEIYRTFLKFPEFHFEILSESSASVTLTMSARMAASEKISHLVEFARTLLPISVNDAGAVFSNATSVAADVDEDAIFELELFSPLAEQATGLGTAEKRSIAVSLAQVVSDISIRLDGNERFPWQQVMNSLAILDPPLALAASCRWEDENLKEIETTLPPVLLTALKRKEISSAAAAAFLAILRQPEPGLLAQILASASPGQNMTLIIEEIARDELLHYRFGQRKEVCDLLAGHSPDDAAKAWLRNLQDVVALRETIKDRSATRARSLSASSEMGLLGDQPVPVRDWRAEERSFLRDAIDWSGRRFIVATEIEDTAAQLRSLAKTATVHITIGSIFRAIGERVTVRDRVAHLDAMRNVQLPGDNDDVPIAIRKRLKEWSGSPAVAEWHRINAVKLLIDRLPAFTRYLKYGDAKLVKEVFDASSRDSELILASLIEGIERHVDNFDAGTVYSLVGFMVGYCSPSDAAELLEWYVDRLRNRIPLEEADDWDPEDLPLQTEAALARFVYAQMSDIDTRNRWRAAHVTRRLVKLGDRSVLGELFHLYERKTEPSFRKPDAPFYWMASRMFLMIAAERIASEDPTALSPHFEPLLRIAGDETFPHLVIRSFAKSAASTLVRTGGLKIRAAGLKRLAAANTSMLRRKVRKESYEEPFPKYRSPEVLTRFNFDQTDTLSYWYSPAVRVFADLDKSVFLSAADSWIVDKWEVKGQPWVWNAEPRRERLEATPYSMMDDSHGTVPVRERYRSYLEWHAMWCAMGELMSRHALAKPDADGYDAFADFLKTEGISEPPIWLSDRNRVKPLIDNFWMEPAKNVDEWVGDIELEDFLSDLTPKDLSGEIVVAGDLVTRSSKFRAGISIESALVETKTAGALMRALQSSVSAYDYKLPKVGENFEIDRFPYRLAAWLQYGNRVHGVDERDPFRNELTQVQVEPAAWVVKQFDLIKFTGQGEKWVSEGKEVFAYDAWSEGAWDDKRERPYYSGIFSEGWRLFAPPAMLEKMLNELGMDLIVEVRVQKRNRDYEYSGRGQEDAKEADYDRLFLIRGDGSIETTEGHIGSWKTSGA